MRRLTTIIAAASLVGCSPSSREAEIAGVMAAADEALIRARPSLVAGKYATMAGDPFSFYRGNLPLFAHDTQRSFLGLGATSFAADDAPLVIGDPHPENFGCLEARDATFGFEGNDFDAAGRAPYLWDVRRLVIGLDLAARLANSGDSAAQATSVAAAQSVARAAASSYASAIAGYANGAPRQRISTPSGAILEDVFDRCVKHSNDGSTFTDLTVLDANGRHLIRGVIDPTQPWQVLEDLPPEALDALPAALTAWSATLIDPPSPDELVVLDAARELGSGVSSWPLVRALVLLRGPTDDPSDDFVVEVKEIGDAHLPNGEAAPFFFDSPQDRILRTTRAAWAIPDADPKWGASEWMGLPIQIRTESSGEKKISVDKMVGDLGTPNALRELATTLGALLARIHASPLGGDQGAAQAIAAAIGSAASAFADEQAAIADAYAQQVIEDTATFAQALSDLGPTLGAPAADESSTDDQNELFGDPP